MEKLIKVYKNGVQVEPLRTYFHCDLNTLDVQWSHEKLNEKQNNIEFISRWKGNKMAIGGIKVSGIYEDNYELFKLPFEYQYTSLPIIKSHLQKCVRRKETDLAIHTAWIMMKIDFEEFIRRLAIIMNEDCFLHPIAFPIVCWITSAYTHEYKPSLKIISWLLGIVKMMCETDIYDPFVHMNNYSEYTYRDIPTTKLSKSEINFLYCLLFRKSFGGMENDVVMMNNSLHEWTKRLENKVFRLDDEYLNCTIEYVMPPINQMSKEHLLLSAIDFHCCPNIIEKLVERYNTILKDFDKMGVPTNLEIGDVIKMAIWIYSSSINNHKDMMFDKKDIREKYNQERDKDGYIHNMWNLIKNDFVLLSLHP